MRLTFTTELGDTISMEVSPEMELESLMALLEAELGIPTDVQSVSYNNRELTNKLSTIAQCGISDGDMLLVRKKVRAGGETIPQDAEMIRLQVLGDPNLLRQLRETQPDLADAAQSNPHRFAELLSSTHARQMNAMEAQRRELEAMNSNPYDIDTQRRIEEAIRQQAVIENLEHALEYSPEAFGRVTMLYVPVEVNGHPVKAFVDSGAQQTIMSPECAEACGLMRLLDQRFSGIARGVGTAKILGRIHMAQLRVADLFLPCSFTVMEGRDVDLLFGLDMLKAHQACIDLEKGVLRIKGLEVPFLAEHELPDKARNFDAGQLEEAQAQGSSGGGADTQAGSSGSSSQSQKQQQHFPGSGSTLGTTPTPGSGRSAPSGNTGAASRYPEQSIRTLMDLGAPREIAISLLDATGGSVDMAASMLF